MTNTIEIKHLSKKEKLRVMEISWEDLSRETKSVESPDWHQKELQETDCLFKSGQERIISWHEAKIELRKRFA